MKARLRARWRCEANQLYERNPTIRLHSRGCADGRISDTELAKLIPIEPQATLAALLAEGLIEVATVSADRASRANPTGRVRRAATFDEVRHAAMRQLSRALGPDADSLNAEIDRVRTVPELRVLLARAALQLRRLHGSASAEAFSARFLAPPEK